MGRRRLATLAVSITVMFMLPRWLFSVCAGNKTDTPPRAAIIYTMETGGRFKYRLYLTAWPNPKPKLLKPKIVGKYGLGDFVAGPGFSPDGTKVLFTANRVLPTGKQVKTDGVYGTDLWILYIKGSTAKPLTTDGASYADSQWSPDGRYVCAISAQGHKPPSGPIDSPAEWKRDLYVWDIATGKRTFISHFVNSVTWSRDSKHLYFESSTKTVIYRIPRTGGKPHVVQTPAEFLGSLSPNGRYLTFGGASPGPKGYVLMVKTLGTARLQSFLGQKGPVMQAMHLWAPDSRRIAVMDVTDDHYPMRARLLIVDTLTGRTRLFDNTSNLVGIAAWSHDGNWIAIGRNWDKKDENYNSMDVISTNTGKIISLVKPMRTSGFDWHELSAK